MIEYYSLEKNSDLLKIKMADNSESNYTKMLTLEVDLPNFMFRDRLLEWQEVKFSSWTNTDTVFYGRGTYSVKY